jgi:hypothetical protein
MDNASAEICSDYVVIHSNPSLIWLQLIQMSDNLDQNMTNYKLKKTTYGIYEQEDFKTALRAAGETETMQENIQDCRLQLWMKEIPDFTF